MNKTSIRDSIDQIISICNDNCNLNSTIDNASDNDIILRGILVEINKLKNLLNL